MHLNSFSPPKLAFNLASRSASVGLVMPTRSKYTLPDLPYDYNALEPVVSAKIMELHHKKHHQTYVNNLNQALEDLDAACQANDLSKQVTLQSAIKFNGGGHLNHSIFWKNLCPVKDATQEPDGILRDMLVSSFGSISQFKDLFTRKTLAIQGSGWGWLGYNKAMKQIQFAVTLNQDPLEPTTGLLPLLGIDVWEHAYYLQYLNARADYLNNIWKIINWKDVSARFAQASSK